MTKRCVRLMRCSECDKTADEWRRKYMELLDDLAEAETRNEFKDNTIRKQAWTIQRLEKENWNLRNRKK